MFGDGKVSVISHEGELYINMWQVVQHLVTSSLILEDREGVSSVSSTLRLIASTLCDLALYELGMETLENMDSVHELIELWDSAK